MNKYLSYTLEAIALIVFVSLIPMLFLVEDSTSIVWTVIIPILPILFITIGYSNWRNICPLAFFSKISQKLTWIEKRKVPEWFEENFYFFQYSLLFISFSSRLILLNFDNFYLGLFLILIILSAFAINLVYTGKSWCNFFCPVGVVEKIYCGSNSHKSDVSSACSTCSACKRNCPDIDMESNYWKESTNNQKTFVFYSFSGLVLGFYLYFYLKSGSFEYYFSGIWAHESISMFSDGFFFAPFIPVFIAAPITLALFSIVSFYIFKMIEQFIWKRKIFKSISYVTLTHRIKIVAAFVAFNIFYAFAGAPAYSHYPLFYAIFHFLVIVMSAIVLHSEFFREESYFLQERFAMKMIKKWDFSKPIPTNLKEIYYTYTNDSKNSADRLKTYRETISDLLQEGILTEESMVILEKLRSQMGISAKDHLDVLRDIKLNNQDLFDTNIEQSAEKKYQRNSYKKMLEDALEEHSELNTVFLQSLQKQFCITDAVHKKIMDGIVNSNGKLHSDVLNLLKQMNSLRRLHKSILNDRSREIYFLKYTIRNEFSKISQDLFTLLHVMYKDYNLDISKLQNMFKYKNIGIQIDLNRDMLNFMDEKIANAIFELKKDFDSIKEVKEVSDNQPIIKYLLENDSKLIAAAALLSTMNYPHEFFADINLDKFTQSDDEEIKALAYKILLQTDNLTTYERMMYLHNIPLFEGIKYNELHLLANATQIITYEPNEYIIEQGGIAHTLFIITSGKVNVEVDGKVTGQLGDEDYFGAVAILADTRRVASVKSITAVTMLTLSKNAFKKFLYENPKISIKLMKEVLAKLLDKPKD
ncbi:Cyclic nucleotide-binding domain-containing protein [Epsilonproteobacteria bacterium SCGC AD-308-P11]|jgi:hypothetical protein|nr:Cyclic nucleotide-binding domain-containing protein [Epsilonproteobacteria bacterium SCGC AD-308-P11]